MYTPEKIAAIRKALGLSAIAFGKLLGVDRNTIYLWESGQRHPRYATLLELDRLAKRVSVAS